MNIAVICGSLRKGSFNMMLARNLAALAPGDMRLTLLECLQLFPHYCADIVETPEIVTRWVDAIAAADGVIMVSPEYNHSVPGTLKNALDWISRDPSKPFAGKPVALQSASTGMLGGARMQYHLRQIMVFFDARLLNKPELFVSHAASRFAADGILRDENTAEAIAAHLAAFRLFVRDHQPERPWDPNDVQQAGTGEPIV
ncbi:NAD(P)H-dependent oxidoreductase [Mesorhizobium sp. M4A.F.Ca.ET.020.02.1.1]|uniref:NADPH-dependent FMN reductase n=1 Tax=unclassified Mesorhizobium TaxID=325217 RepID=UPI000FD45897|nr:MULTISPECIES: NAD(P)H-dependent oxidoreductase [unclassified Mesorhizobium]RVD33066.1 NAD(P)H-dependent oxidoreductase [Mesorhizobium sp. M4A.F.Ca.ET.020.02.1.1]RWC15576.1 MAG: NAD(P)H-dependent oxidoreductase [Mesorhizobium sp.]